MGWLFNDLSSGSVPSLMGSTSITLTLAADMETNHPGVTTPGDPNYAIKPINTLR
jgi:hypothetical protein